MVAMIEGLPRERLLAAADELFYSIDLNTDSVVPPEGLEPPTRGLGNRCSSPLSYGGGSEKSTEAP